MASPKRAKKTAEQLTDDNFRRQNITFEKKGYRLSGFDADVFILVRRKGKLSGFTSRSCLNDPHWPPKLEEIAKHYPLPIISLKRVVILSTSSTRL